jgi:heme exporter protein D
MAKPSKASKFFRNLLTVLLVVIILCTLGINLLFKDDSSAPFIFGNGFYIMQQANIQDVDYGVLVISDKNKISEIQAGNVVLCLTSYDDFKEVLRVQEITQEDGVTYYVVKSDDIDDTPKKLSSDKIVAKCTYTNAAMGKLIAFVKSWKGIAILVGGCGIILVWLYVSSYKQKREEELREAREEEERKARANQANQNRNRQRRPNPNGGNRNGEGSNRPKNSNGNNPNRRPKSQNPNGNTNHQGDNTRSRNRAIAVTQLSEEESVKQRENVSNMVGSELTVDNQAKEITREFNSAEVVVSQSTNLEAIRIHESGQPVYSSENVHSPNMEQKAVEIKKALSQNEIEDTDVKPIIKTDETVNTSAPVAPVVPVVAETPQEPIKPVETPKEDNNTPIEPIKPIQQEQEVAKPTTTEPVRKKIVGIEEFNDTMIVIPTDIPKSESKPQAQEVQAVQEVQKAQEVPAVETPETIPATLADTVEEKVETVENKVETKVEQVAEKVETPVATPAPVQPVAQEQTPVQETPKPVQETPKQVQETSKPVQKSKTTTAQKSTPKKNSKLSNIDKLINDEDNFLDNLFENESSTSDNVKVSDDLLDALLNSIPSTHADTTATVTESVPTTNVAKTSTTKTTHHKKSSSSTHKSTSKKVDDTSFDELIKAIEKEKHSNK